MVKGPLDHIVSQLFAYILHNKCTNMNKRMCEKKLNIIYIYGPLPALCKGPLRGENGGSYKEGCLRQGALGKGRGGIKPTIENI